MINMERTGARISQLRKAHGMTQAELAAKLMVSPQAVSKWETGQSLPDTGQILAISQLFGVTINSILTGEAQDAEAFQRSTPISTPISTPTSTPTSTQPSDKDGERADKVEERVGRVGRDEDRFDTDQRMVDEVGRGERPDGNDEMAEEEPLPPKLLQTIIDMAPFIDEDTLAEMLKDCDWSVATVRELESVAAYLSSDVVDRLLERVPRPSESEVFRLAPFLGSSKLASLVQDFEENLALEQLRQLSAYLPPEVCSRIFMRLLNEPGDYRFEELAPFAPFIDDEALVALVRTVPPPDLQALKKIAPFLEEEEVGRLLRGLLKGESDHR